VKPRVRAKRRWFTPRNYARIALRTRWGRLEGALADAFVAPDPAQRLTQAVADEVRRTLLRVFCERVVRPLAQELMAGMSGPKPRGFLDSSA
jgi:hypothetical protein